MALPCGPGSLKQARGAKRMLSRYALASLYLLLALGAMKATIGPRSPVLPVAHHGASLLAHHGTTTADSGGGNNGGDDDGGDDDDSYTA